MVSFAIQCFLIGGVLALAGWLMFGVGAALFLSGPMEFLAVIAITVIGGLVKACAAR